MHKKGRLENTVNHFIGNSFLRYLGEHTHCSGYVETTEGFALHYTTDFKEIRLNFRKMRNRTSTSGREESVP